MDIGTAIFLSSRVFAVVILYNITKDRWRWGEFARGVGGGLATIVKVFVAIVIGTIVILILNAIANQFGH